MILGLVFPGLSGCREGNSPKCYMPGPTADDSLARPAPLVTLQGAALNRAKRANFECPRSWGADVKQLKYSANRTRSLPLRTIVDKTGIAPSGDRHDYFSIGRYFWPDPDKANGLPWKRRDGQINPDVMSAQYDKVASDAMFSAVSTLATAYFFLGDEAYAQRAAEYLRAWFIEPATAMNPNLTYAEGVPGDAEGRAQGLIEFSKLVDLFDAVALISDSPAWPAESQNALRAWMLRYYEWLTTHPNPLKESEAKNNHGTYFDAQRAALAVYLGKIDEARSVIDGAKTKRLAAQVMPDGSQPEEIARANSWFYSTFNLMALADLAAIGGRVGVDLWGYKTEDGRSLRGALDFLLPYAFEGKEWPHNGGVEIGRLYEPLLRASAGLADPRYGELARSLGDTDGDGYAEDDDRARGPVRLLWGFADK